MADITWSSLLPSQVFSHGLPHHPTALAYDVLQSLVAIGNNEGTIRIYPLTKLCVFLQCTGLE